MSGLPDVYIVAAVRTPLGSFQGFVTNEFPDLAYQRSLTLSLNGHRSLASISAPQLGAHAIKGEFPSLYPSCNLLTLIRSCTWACALYKAEGCRRSILRKCFIGKV